jgi:hypothetical protein
MYSSSHRHCVERLEADPLMHQHVVIIEGAGYARVTECYGDENLELEAPVKGPEISGRRL